MSHSTYLHLYSPHEVLLEAEQINTALRILGVREVVKIYRAIEELNEWTDFVRGTEEWPDYEIVGQRISPGEAGSYYDPKKYLSVDCVRGHPEDRRAQLVNLIHNNFPTEVQRDFYLNNLVLKVGPHDIYEIVENPTGELFARTSFSVAFWGYRHPENVEGFRAFLRESALVRDIQSDLSAIIRSSIDYRIYLT